MIELIQDRLKHLSNSAEVHQPTVFQGNRAGDLKSNGVAVTVEPAALVIHGYFRQTMCRIETELFENLHGVKNMTGSIPNQHSKRIAIIPW